MINQGRCVKEEFSSNIGFSIEKGFLLETVFVGKKKTSDEEEVVEGEFPGGKVLDKEELWNRKLVFDSTPLLF